MSWRPLVLRYGCAVISIALATWVRLLLHPLLGNEALYSILLFAVLLTASFGGVWPASLAVVLGSLSADYFLVGRGAACGSRVRSSWWPGLSTCSSAPASRCWAERCGPRG